MAVSWEAGEGGWGEGWEEETCFHAHMHRHTFRFQPAHPFNNPILAALVLSNSRSVLYAALESLGERVIYTDTVGGSSRMCAELGCPF